MRTGRSSTSVLSFQILKSEAICEMILQQTINPTLPMWLIYYLLQFSVILYMPIVTVIEAIHLDYLYTLVHHFFGEIFKQEGI